MSAHLLNLLHLTDPALPVGGFSHSGGLETYVQQGIVKDTPSANAYIRQMLSANLAYNDAAFMSLAYDAAQSIEGRNAGSEEGDTSSSQDEASERMPALHTTSRVIEALLALDAQCTALKVAREMREASQKLGLRLIKIFQQLSPFVPATAYADAIRSQAAAGHYCIAFGVYACGLGIPKTEAITAFYYNAAAGMVTNCVKLVPLGQLHGQTLLFQLQPLIQELVAITLQPDPASLGRCNVAFDIRSMQHERLYSRLYMS